MNKSSKLFFAAFMLLQLTACGGSSSGSTGTLIEGSLTEGAGIDHSSLTKHGAGEFIEEVLICAFNRCSRTDGIGQWGFYVEDDNFTPQALFTIDGHGINTDVVVNFPHDTREAFIHFEHNHGKVIVHHMDINGARIPSPGHEHSHDDSYKNSPHNHGHGGF